MSHSPASLLLFACAVVQLLLLHAGPHAPLVAIAATSGAYAGLAILLGVTPVTLGAELLAFWAASAAMVAGHRHLRARLDALTALCDVDETTRCLSRRGFSARLESTARAAMRTGAPVAMLALDLDHFKQVNDRFGHLSGDAVLGEVGATLMRTVGDHGVVARLGGEEFAVLLPDTDVEGAGEMAERILDTLRGLRPAALPADARLTMSVGIAAERIHEAHTASALRARADHALYAAKRSGRDRALLWAPGVHSHATPVRALRAIPA